MKVVTVGEVGRGIAQSRWGLMPHANTSISFMLLARSHWPANLFCIIDSWHSG